MRLEFHLDRFSNENGKLAGGILLNEIVDRIAAAIEQPASSLLKSKGLEEIESRSMLTKGCFQDLGQSFSPLMTRLLPVCCLSWVSTIGIFLTMCPILNSQSKAVDDHEHQVTIT